MLTDRDLRALFAEANLDDAPDDDFAARLFSTVAASRARRRARPAWSNAVVDALAIARPRWLVATGVVLLALALVGTAILVGAFRQRPPLKLPAIGFASMIPLGGAPSALALDDRGSIWIVIDTGLVRLVPATARMDSPIVLGSGSVVGVRAAGGSVWAGAPDGRGLLRVDTATATVAGTVRFDHPTGLAVDDSSPRPGLLVISDAQGAIEDIDSASLVTRWAATVPGTPRLVGEGGGLVVVAFERRADGTLGLIAYDPSTGAVVGSADLTQRSAPSSMVVSRVGSNSGRVWLPDPEAGTIVGIDLGPSPSTHVIQIGSNPMQIFERPDGALVVGFGATRGSATQIAVVEADTGHVHPYAVRPDDPGAGHGLTGIVASTSSEATGSATSWSLWMALDWQAAPSIGRVQSSGLP